MPGTHHLEPCGHPTSGEDEGRAACEFAFGFTDTAPTFMCEARIAHGLIRRWRIHESVGSPLPPLPPLPPVVARVYSSCAAQLGLPQTAFARDPVARHADNLERHVDTVSPFSAMLVYAINRMAGIEVEPADRLRVNALAEHWTVELDYLGG